MKWRAVWTNRNVGDILMFSSPSEGAEIAFQVINYCKMSEIGSPLPILGKITISLAIHAMKGRRRGSLRAIYSRNGNHPDQVLFSGYTGNVSRCYALLYTLADADDFPLSQPEQAKVSFGTLTSKYLVSNTYGAG